MRFRSWIALAGRESRGSAGRLVFFADSHWVAGDQELEPVKIASTDVANAPDLTAPDMEKFWDDYYEKQGVPRPDRPQGQP